MSATAIAQAAIQYAPQAISAAKSLIAKFAPQIASTVEATAQVAGSVADSGIAQNILHAKELISSDTSITNKLFGLSTHLSETHPEIASKLEGYAIKLLNKTGLSDEEISFLHDQVTKISEAKEEYKLTDSKPKVEPTAEDVHILINLIAKGGLDPSFEEAYIKTLNSQTAVPLAEVKQRLIEATEKHHPSEQAVEETPTINSSGVEQSSSISILDNSLTDEQQKIILEASKKIPIQVSNKSLSNLVQEYLPYEGIQSTLSALGVKKPDFFSDLTKIATGGVISLGDYKTTVSGLLGAFGIDLPQPEQTLNHLHTQHEVSINETKPEQIKKGEPQPQTTTQSEPSNETSSANTSDSETVLKNMLGLINTKIIRKNSHVYMFLKWVGPVLNLVGINVPTPEELPAKVEQYLTKNEVFTNAMKNFIENKDVDTSNMSWWQSWVFSGCKKVLKHLANNPKSLLDNAPQAAYAMRYSQGAIIPLLGKIPFIGRLLGVAYPFIVDEFDSVSGIKEQEYLKNILQVLAKHHTTPESTETPTAAEQNNNAHTTPDLATVNK